MGDEVDEEGEVRKWFLDKCRELGGTGRWYLLTRKEGRCDLPDIKGAIELRRAIGKKLPTIRERTLFKFSYLARISPNASCYASIWESSYGDIIEEGFCKLRVDDLPPDLYKKFDILGTVFGWRARDETWNKAIKEWRDHVMALYNSFGRDIRESAYFHSKLTLYFDQILSSELTLYFDRSYSSFDDFMRSEKEVLQILEGSREFFSRIKEGDRNEIFRKAVDEKLREVKGISEKIFIVED